ncbi:kinase-like domain-containing protein [Bombardia bombarda]|uniref:Kinase-like domain-containing protein n=1 Tax=Bombardia bombarda TaxID=252184 RepID=A0AA39XNJ4_9PEZI|nr:kinase-like domain-containing protein [Bombardia bombarda]
MAHPESARQALEIQRELSNTKYACSVLEPLSGGTVNYIFKGLLTQPLEDGTTEIAIKHGEGFIASNPGFELTTARCGVEEGCLESMSRLPAVTSGCVSVRTPKLYHFNQESNTQIQECFNQSVDLKTYALRYFSKAGHVSRKSQCLDIGHGLGAWLRSLHDWVVHPEQSQLQETAMSNTALQAVKLKFNYLLLVPTVDRHPSILEEARGTFEQVEMMGKKELESPDIQVIHGDFWTGNALLPDIPLEKGAQTSIFIVDWEMCQLGVRPLDVGQMIAELYELFLFKGIEEGKWVIEGFAAGYGYIDDNFAFRTAIHVGTHLVCWGSRVPGWGSEAQIEQVVARGRDLIVHAWHKDRSWFEAGELACLFSRS